MTIGLYADVAVIEAPKKENVEDVALSYGLREFCMSEVKLSLFCYDKIADVIGGLPCCPYLQTYDESPSLRRYTVNSSDKCTPITTHVDKSLRISLGSSRLVLIIYPKDLNNQPLST